MTLLKRCGVTVAKQAVNGEEAVRFASAEDFDAIFMDIQSERPGWTYLSADPETLVREQIITPRDLPIQRTST